MMSLTKDEVLDAIRQTAAKHGGKTPTMKELEEETGIRMCAWYNKYWKTWNEAVKDAGFEPNKRGRGKRLNGYAVYNIEWVIEELAEYTRQLGRFPERSDIRAKRREYRNESKKPPNYGWIIERLGVKKERVLKIAEFCKTKQGYDDVYKICMALAHELEKKD